MVLVLGAQNIYTLHLIVDIHIYFKSLLKMRMETEEVVVSVAGSLHLLKNVPHDRKYEDYVYGKR